MKMDGMRELNKVLNNIVGRSQNATKSALHRSAQGVGTEANRKVREEYTVKAGDVKNTIRIQHRGDHEIDILSRGSALSLPKFRLTPRAPVAKQPNKAVKVAVKKGSTKKIKRDFVAAMPNAHIGAFSRVPGVAKKRKRNAKGDYPGLPIAESFGPAVPVLMNNDRVVKHVEDQAIERMDKRMTHEFGRIFK